MRTIPRAGWGLLAAVTMVACSSPPPNGGQAARERPASTGPTRPSEVTLTVVKWPDLDRAIAAQKGKVVVLDVWGEF